MKKITLFILLAGILAFAACSKETEKVEIITVCTGGSQTYTLYETYYKFCEYCEEIEFSSDRQDMSREEFIYSLTDAGYTCK